MLLLTNVRSRGIHCHGCEFSADELENLYLHLSRGQHNWPKRLRTDTFTKTAADASFDAVQVYLGNLSTDPLPSEQWKAGPMAVQRRRPNHRSLHAEISGDVRSTGL